MKNWNELFIRHGWLISRKDTNVFDCTRETEENIRFLLESLEKASIPYSYEYKELILPTMPMSEKKWLRVLDFEGRGRGEGLWFNPNSEQPKISELDTYICGIVRQLNRLGFHTIGSCDGHNRRPAHVLITKEHSIDEITSLFQGLGYNKIRIRENKSHFQLKFHSHRFELLELAQKLSSISSEWISKGEEAIKEYLFQQLVEELLEIPGVSGEEELVRDYIMEELTPYVDHIIPITKETF